jgi:AraC-like DNA-binding protein
VAGEYSSTLPVYLERPPSNELAGLVRRFWFLSAHTAGGIERILPIPWVHVIVNLGEPYVVERQGDRVVGRRFDSAFVSGLQRSYLLNTNPEHLFHVGAALEPFAWRVFGAEPFIDDVRDAAEVWPALGQMREALGPSPSPEQALDVLEAALIESLTGTELDALVVATSRAIEANPATRIGTIAHKVGLSSSALAPRFKRATGINPKQFADLHRFQEFLGLLATPGPLPTWTDLIAQSHYYDQPHFIRTFSRLTGLTPRRYLRALGEQGRASPAFVPPVTE